MRRDLIADAAIQLVAEQGMRGLTHLAVDRRAGLPKGSTSAYFRTRQALIEGFVERLANQQRLDVVPDADDVAAASRGRRQLARRAEHHAREVRGGAGGHAPPELTSIMVHSPREQATAIAKMLGHEDPERAGAHLTAFLEGLLFYRLAGGGSTVGPAPGTGHRAPSTEHRAPSTEHRAPSTEHRAPSTEHRGERAGPEEGRRKSVATVGTVGFMGFWYGVFYL